MNAALWTLSRVVNRERSKNCYNERDNETCKGKSQNNFLIFVNLRMTRDTFFIIKIFFFPFNRITMQLFTDGITNKLIGCIHGDEVLLVRIYGNKTDLLIDRKAEKKNIAFLHQHRLAPELFATFRNGLVYEFVPGCTLNTTSVWEPKIWRLVAANMARMHKLPLSSEDLAKEPMLKTKTIKFLDLIPERFSDPVKHDR